MNNAVRTIALTGGTGFVGKNVIDMARAQKIPVRALTRRPQKPVYGVTWVEGSLSDGEALKELCDGAGTVIHVAGVVNAPDKKGFEDGNVAGTLAMVDAAKAMGLPRFVHVSSLAAREPDLSIYGWSKAKAEKIVAASGLDWTIVRPPAIYGPGDGEMLDLFKMAQRGFVLLPPEGRLSLIHATDLARLLIELRPSSEDVTSQIFEADDGAKGGWTHKAFARAIGTALGRGIRPLSLPPALLRLGAGVDRLVRNTNAKLTPDRVSYMCHDDWTVDASSRPPRSLWMPKIETRDGLRQTALWYKKAGWL
ncbi:NAD(P)-dependent oxidoreductase [Sphingorhabdus sp. Alg239-R122]|uniref:SDR family oxidoreductase n=1 Tax=Sphingorhabdus sp. Alg239-R122 TaxID=2305989 RepID=UPI001F0758B9|nr:NAD(P)-dependent oxidoreductase [Sphingorhabdus sp. Alg239-R122]